MYNLLEDEFRFPSDEPDKVRRSIQASSNLSTRWDDQRCKDEAERLVQYLLHPGILKFIAMHEAGHEWYFDHAGCTTKPEPSKIIYHRANDLFVGQVAAIVIDNCKAETEGDPGLVKMAEGYAAGGMCAWKPKPKAEYYGDTNDREKFLKLYAQQRPGQSGEEMWLAAQKSVKNNLIDGSLVARIDERADELLPILFPWVKREKHS